VLFKEQQDIVGILQRERVNDQPAHPEFRVPACRARVRSHRVQLEVGDRPADISAIRPWAKLLMMLEAGRSIVLAALVITRAINVL
jgi:hypothetical protein